MIDRTITYRLIGASIMVLSAAIVLPLILDGERPAELDIEVEVSTPPAFSEIKVATVQSVDSLAVASSTKEKSPNDIHLIPISSSSEKTSGIAKTTPEVAAKKTSSEVKSKSPSKVSTQKPVTVAANRWTVQIATFKSRDNTTRLVKRLKDKKYDAYSITTNSLYKVYVGPEFKRETSEKIRNEIKKEFNLSGIVVKFSVN